MINQDQFIALLPQLLSSILILVVMGLTAIRRCHATIAATTVLGLAATLVSIPYAASVGPQAVTALFIVDGQALFYTGLILAAAIGTTLLLWGYLKNFAGNREEMYLLLTLSVNGALMLVVSRHMASFFVGLELMTVPLYGMAGYLFMQRRPLESATKYLVLSATATAFLLFGMAFLYAQSGRLDFAGIATQFTSGYTADAWLAQAGLTLMLVGIAFKLSLAPFHQWTLDVYEGAPAPVGAFLATVSKVAVVAVLLRLLEESGVLRMYPSDAADSLPTVLATVAVVSILVGNLLALRQDNLKRLLAASSIAHFGYLLIAIVVGGQLAREAAGMYLTAYVATTIGAFGVLSLLSRHGNNNNEDRDADTLGAVRGLAARSPFLAVVLTVMLLSLAGIPLTAGFLGKFYVITAGASAGLWGLLLMVVIGSAMGLYYYLRVIAAIYQPAEPGLGKIGVERMGGIAVAAALLAVFCIGIWPEPLADVLQSATLTRLP